MRSLTRPDCERKLLMLAPAPSAAGPIPRLARWLAAGLQEHGWTADVLPWGSASPSGSLAKRADGRVQQLQAIVRETHRVRYDAVLVHTAHDWRAVIRDTPLVEVVRHRLPVVVMFHGSLAPGFGRDRHSLAETGLRRVARRADALLVLSEDERTQWLTLDARLTVKVVRNCFRPSVLAVTPVVRTVQAPVQLLYVGRLVEQKGVLEVIRAAATVHRRRDCALTIAGSGPAESAARRAAVEWGIEGAVRFVGFVGGDDLQELYASSDVLLLPTWWREGFPTVLLEAMSAGLPLIVSPVGGIPDQLEDGVNAVFVPPHDPEKLAAAILDLVDDHELMRRMSLANRLKIQEYRPEVVAADYAEVLAWVARRRNASSDH